MGRVTNELLAKLGAESVCPYGEGDDDGTLEDDFQQWRDNVLWPTLIQKYHGGSTTSGKHMTLPVYCVTV
jgi:NADPH-ferrihemoprotein reductase